VLADHYERVAERAGRTVDADSTRRLLIGAYFTMEYAFESAALFNPSMVPSVDQSEAPEGSLRFAMSLRAVGEGHVSSVVFRRGTVGANGDVEVDDAGRSCRAVRRGADGIHDAAALRADVVDAWGHSSTIDLVLGELPDHFTTGELREAVGRLRPTVSDVDRFNALTDDMLRRADCAYELHRVGDWDLSELVLFPISESESQGIEDMRLVRFCGDDGSRRYFGTYTAFNGREISPQLLEISQPAAARVHRLSGRFARNKGPAIFPRKVDGRYAMVARVDGESNYLAWSESPLLWEEAVRIQEPEFPWEFVQIGNCGSPIETGEGWLLLTHGVGPMRRYCMGAVLLDLRDPSRVIARTAEPLLMPEADERTGYVPNVVYSCGGLVHGGNLVIPYGISDAATGFAVVELADLMHALTS
jgi:predicted GH43/DUF377 family glycosyl hydrolase